MQTIEVQGARVPAFFYGTAWKEERTADLVTEALAAGFRGIDTANQRKHYFEGGVGDGIAAAGVAREDLFLQTKFTYERGQDHRLPYDPEARLAEQVAQSLASSLEHLRCERIDSLVLHGPERGDIWSDADREVWRAMEEQRESGRVRLLGVSNIARGQLETLLGEAAVAPAFVQNRCYARTGWDREVRALCRDAGAVYQGFSLLTANRAELASEKVRAIAERHGAAVPQVIFRFAMQVGMLPLTGTSSRAHMDQDLACASLNLDVAEIESIEAIGLA